MPKYTITTQKTMFYSATKKVECDEDEIENQVTHFERKVKNGEIELNLDGIACESDYEETDAE